MLRPIRQIAMATPASWSKLGQSTKRGKIDTAEMAAIRQLALAIRSNIQAGTSSQRSEAWPERLQRKTADVALLDHLMNMDLPPGPRMPRIE